MKPFLFRISIIGSLNLIFILLFYTCLIKIIKERITRIVKLPDECSILFSGDSNIGDDINDYLIPKSKNIASDGEAYFYTYLKIKTILENNRQVKTVFLGFAPHNIAKSAEDNWMFSDKWIQKRSCLNFLMNSYEKIVLIKKNPGAYIKSIGQACQSFIMIIINSYKNPGFISNTYFGGFQNMNDDRMDDDIKKNPDKFEQFPFERGELQIKYLMNISQLCSERSVHLILLNTPKSKYYTKNINKETLDYYFHLHRDICKDSLLDLSDFILQDKYFADRFHLNSKGSKIFSEQIAQMIKKSF